MRGLKVLSLHAFSYRAILCNCHMCQCLSTCNVLKKSVTQLKIWVEELKLTAALCGPKSSIPWLCHLGALMEIFM